MCSILLCTKKVNNINKCDTSVYLCISVLGHADSATSLLLSVTDSEINDEFNSASALLGCQEISGCHTANLVNLIEEIFIE